MTRTGVNNVITVLSSLILGLVLLFSSSFANAQRIKDIVQVEGVRSNQLIGYGLVVGLNGTGDTVQNAPFTRQSIEAMLERMGVNIRGENMRPGNVAAVMVTAELPPFARVGTEVDVAVSSFGDAKDLTGGTLLVTPLLSADGDVYAVAAGSIAVAGFTAEGESGSITQGVPTAGRIANGAIVEKEINFEMNDMLSIRLSLNNPDFTTARRIAEAINEAMGQTVATPMDPSTIQLIRPMDYTKPMFDLIADIESLSVDIDLPARVVIDDRSGVIVIGSRVRIAPVAVALGSLNIKVTETEQVSQPAPLSDGETTTTTQSSIQVDTGKVGNLTVLDTGVTLQDLVDAMNALELAPRDVISILQALKVSGALQAELEVM